MSDIALAPVGAAQLERAEAPEYTPPPAPPVNLNTAIASAQGRFRLVAKTKSARIVSDKGTFTYKYADLADILEMALPILAACGLSLRQPIRRLGPQLVVVTEIHHLSGEYMSDDGLPLPAGGSPQAFGSALTYMRRYGACSLLGIAPDADEDGALATAEKRERDELDRARGRNERAMSQGPAPVTQAASAAGTSDSAGWTAEMVKAFNMAWKKGGWSKDDAAVYMRDVLAVTVLKMAHPGQHPAAIAWGERGAVKAAGGEVQAAAAPQRAAEVLDGAQKASFWDTARKHGKTDAEVGRYFETLKIKSTSEMLVSQLPEALKWAATPIDGGEPVGPAEKTARQGMAILGLDLNQQAELVDAHKGNWAAIAEACSAEIARRDEQQP